MSKYVPIFAHSHVLHFSMVCPVKRAKKSGGTIFCASPKWTVLWIQYIVAGRKYMCISQDRWECHQECLSLVCVCKGQHVCVVWEKVQFCTCSRTPVVKKTQEVCETEFSGQQVVMQSCLLPVQYSKQQTVSTVRIGQYAVVGSSSEHYVVSVNQWAVW